MQGPSPYGLDDILIMIFIVSKYAKNVKKFLVGFGRGARRGVGRGGFSFAVELRAALDEFVRCAAIFLTGNFSIVVGLG